MRKQNAVFAIITMLILSSCSPGNDDKMTSNSLKASTEIETEESKVNDVTVPIEDESYIETQELSKSETDTGAEPVGIYYKKVEYNIYNTASTLFTYDGKIYEKNSLVFSIDPEYESELKELEAYDKEGNIVPSDSDNVAGRSYAVGDYSADYLICYKIESIDKYVQYIRLNDIYVETGEDVFVDRMNLYNTVLAIKNEAVGGESMEEELSAEEVKELVGILAGSRAEQQYIYTEAYENNFQMINRAFPTEKYGNYLCGISFADKYGIQTQIEISEGGYALIPVRGVLKVFNVGQELINFYGKHLARK
jgi:hypothetical protein